MLTPLVRSQNMGTILVDRGWVPREYVRQNTSWDRPKGFVNIVGVASETESKLYFFIVLTWIM